MSKAQPQTPLIRQSPLTGQWYCLTKYKQKDNAIVVTSEHGRHDVTKQIRQLLIMETEELTNQRDALLAACKVVLPIVVGYEVIELLQNAIAMVERKGNG